MRTTPHLHIMSSGTCRFAFAVQQIDLMSINRCASATLAGSNTISCVCATQTYTHILTVVCQYIDIHHSQYFCRYRMFFTNLYVPLEKNYEPYGFLHNIYLLKSDYRHILLLAGIMDFNLIFQYLCIWVTFVYGQ